MGGGGMYGSGMGGMYGGGMGGMGGMYGGGMGGGMMGPGGPYDPSMPPPAPPSAWQHMLMGVNGVMTFFGEGTALAVAALAHACMNLSMYHACMRA